MTKGPCGGLPGFELDKPFAGSYGSVVSTTSGLLLDMVANRVCLRLQLPGSTAQSMRAFSILMGHGLRHTNTLRAVVVLTSLLEGPQSYLPEN